MPETAKKSQIEVSLLTDENIEMAAEFFRAVWDPDATAEKVRRGREQTARDDCFFSGQTAPAVLFIREGHALGYCGSIPILLWSGDKVQRAEWVKGLMVLPEHRNGPIGFFTLKELLRQLDLPLSLVVGEPARRLLAALGLKDLGRIPNFLRLLKAGSVLRKLDPEALGISERAPWSARAVKVVQRLKLTSLAGACIDIGRSLRVGSIGAAARRLVVEAPATWPETAELDALWQDVRGEISVAPVRHGRYLQWRYAKSREYSLVTVRNSNRLEGIAIVRRPQPKGDPRLNGIRLSVLSDLVFSPHHPDAASALLRGVDDLSRIMGAEAVLSSASHSAVVSALRRHGVVSIPANMHLMVGHKTGQQPLPGDLSSWWITRGDSNADEVF